MDDWSGIELGPEEIQRRMEAFVRMESPGEKFKGKAGQTILDYLQRLDEPFQALLSVRFGLDPEGHPRTQQEVADILNWPLHDVQRMEAAAIAQMQERSRGYVWRKQSA